MPKPEKCSQSRRSRFDIETLRKTLNAEQIDAVGMRQLAHRQNRGIMEADATGI